MKKKYIKPKLTCIKIECEGIIAGSGRPNVNDPLDPSTKSRKRQNDFWDN